MLAREPEEHIVEVSAEPVVVIKTVEVPVEPVMHYSEETRGATPEEIELLYRIVYHEARGESQLGQRAVAEVVLNRVGNDRFPETITAVLNQRGQFVPVNELWDMPIREQQAYEKCKESVQIVLQCQEPVLDSEVVYFRTANTYGGHVRFERIGGHSFFYI